MLGILAYLAYLQRITKILQLIIYNIYYNNIYKRNYFNHLKFTRIEENTTINLFQ